MASLRLLVVDDNGDDVALLKHAFGAQGLTAEIVRASDGVEAVQLCSDGKGQSFHVILLDYYLPKLDGGQVAVRLKEMGVIPGVPVVLFTSHLPPVQEAALKGTGSLTFMEKPTDFTGFCAVATRIADLGPSF
jgi:CheY-like chemotaxis protein